MIKVSLNMETKGKLPLMIKQKRQLLKQRWKAIISPTSSYKPQKHTHTVDKIFPKCQLQNI